jgi:signal transduction histidine kinase
VLGDLPDVLDVVETDPLFDENLPTRATVLVDFDQYPSTVESENVDLVVIDTEAYEHGMLDEMRRNMPTHPVVLVCEGDRRELELEAKERGIESVVSRRGDDDALFRRYLARELYSVLKRFVEPPSMVAPNVLDLYRYAQFYNVLHPFFVVDPDDVLRYFNHSAEQFCRDVLDHDVVVGTSVRGWGLDESRDAFHDNLKAAFEGEEIVSRPTFSIGERRESRELHYAPVLDSEGRVVAVTLAIYMEPRPELEHLRSLQALGRLAGGVAHDFNNLLGIVSTCSELVRSQLPEQMDPERRALVDDNLDRIVDVVDRGASLTRQLLAYSHHGSTERRRLDLNTCLERSRDLVGKIIGEDVAIECSFGADLPEIHGIPGHIDQIVMNMAANARDAMPRGGTLTVRTSRVELDEDELPSRFDAGTYVCLTIGDTGVGMDEQQLDRIFEPFYTTKSDEEYRGLGLAGVKSIVEQFGGFIRVESEPGAGTTFELYFPSAALHDV